MENLTFLSRVIFQRVTKLFLLEDFIRICFCFATEMIVFLPYPASSRFLPPIEFNKLLVLDWEGADYVTSVERENEKNELEAKNWWSLEGQLCQCLMQSCWPIQNSNLKSRKRSCQRQFYCRIVLLPPPPHWKKEANFTIFHIWPWARQLNVSQQNFHQKLRHYLSNEGKWGCDKAFSCKTEIKKKVLDHFILCHILEKANWNLSWLLKTH